MFTDAVTIDFHGQDGRAFHGSKTGKLFLTTHRLIFINKSDKDELLSFSMPFVTLKDVSVSKIALCMMFKNVYNYSFFVKPLGGIGATGFRIKLYKR